VGVVFLEAGDALFTLHLKSAKTTKVYGGFIQHVVHAWSLHQLLHSRYCFLTYILQYYYFWDLGFEQVDFSYHTFELFSQYWEHPPQMMDQLEEVGARPCDKLKQMLMFGRCSSNTRQNNEQSSASFNTFLLRQNDVKLPTFNLETHWCSLTFSVLQ
jgi:hypothetical protein